MLVSKMSLSTVGAMPDRLKIMSSKAPCVNISVLPPLYLFSANTFSTRSASKWKLPSSPFRTLTILKSTASSIGDAMRDLDNRDHIVGDFLVVSGDVISNMSVEPALVKHRARREKDKNAIMTMVLTEAGIGHRTKSKGSRPVFVIDPIAERCLHYEEMGRRRSGSRYLNLDPEVLSHGEVEIREDLIDCHVDICTPDVLAQWSENFDFQSLRKSFLRGILKDYETYGKTIHTYVVADQYATRVKSLRAYDAVSKDVTGRWTYPLCPDSNLVPGQNYHFGKSKAYQENGVILARAAAVKNRSVVGSGTSIGDGSVIAGSMLGRRCKIGKNVTIDGAYIWDDVTVEDGSTIRQAIVANGTSIGKNCRVESGALISFGVRIPESTTVSGTSKITRTKEESLSTTSADDSDSSSVASSHLIYCNPSASYSNSSVSTFTSSDAEFEPRVSSRRSSVRSDPSDDGAENRDFHVEATASILDGLQKDDASDTIILELNGYRMSTNASQHEVRKAIVAAFMKRITGLIEGDLGASGVSAHEAVKKVFTNYKALVERSMFDKEADQKADQVDFLMLIQKEVLGRPNGDQLLLFAAKEVWDLDIVEEDGILQWWEDQRSMEGDMRKVRGLTEQFIVYLKEAEEDEESSDEDEDDDDE